MNLSNPFSSLRHKNFRYYWIGLFISLIGTWMQNIAQPWLAYSLTQSAFLISLVVALQFAPMLLFSLFAGVLIDKFPKKKILLFTQTASLLITLMLAILVSTDLVQYWHIIVAATAIGFVNTLDLPTRQSFVFELVGKKDLLNAVALNMSVFNLARILGPALAGVVMGYGGIAACFYANSVSFAAVIVGLLFIKPLSIQNRLKPDNKIMVDVKDGLKYIYHDKLLLMTVLSAAIVGTFAINFAVLVPVFAKVILKQQEAGFGFLMSLIGVGSFIGAIWIASLSKGGPKKFFLHKGPLLIAVFMIFTGFTNIYALTGLSLAVTGFCVVTFSSTANSIMQLNAVDEYRGRVMSVYSLFFNGFTPIGTLYAGSITELYGPRAGFIASGGIIVLLVMALNFYFKSKISNARKITVTTK